MGGNNAIITLSVGLFIKFEIGYSKNKYEIIPYYR